MEYRVFPPPCKGVLRKTQAEGVVFADGNTVPLRSYGVWAIKEKGYNDSDGHYAVASPVMPIAKNSMIPVYYSASTEHWKNSVHHNRIKAAFPEYDCSDLGHVVALARKVGQHKVNAAAFTKQDCSREHFYVDTLYCGTPRSTNAAVYVCYFNGERDCKPLKWVYRNRSRLADFESAEFDRIKGTVTITVHNREKARGEFYDQ